MIIKHFFTYSFTEIKSDQSKRDSQFGYLFSFSISDFNSAAILSCYLFCTLSLHLILSQSSIICIIINYNNV